MVHFVVRQCAELQSHQRICLAGLTPFVWLLYSHQSIIALIVVCNGVWFHTSQRTIARQCDVLCNVLLVASVNAITPHQPLTAIITVVAAACWRSNSLGDTPLGAIRHVVGVQWPLAVALWTYVGGCDGRFVG